MKKQTLAACVCAAITLCVFSCDWFGKSHKTAVPTTALLVGKWQVTEVKDSAKRAKSNWSLFDDFDADSTKIIVQFNGDSTLILSSAKPAADTAKYYIDSIYQKFFVLSKSDTNSNKITTDSFAMVTLNDSIFWVAKDSIYVKLKKQP